MSIRFNCLACRAVLKIPEAIKDQRKVRCTSCNIVLILNPDPTSENGLDVSLPEQSFSNKKYSDRELARKRNLLFGALGVVSLMIAIALWWTFRPPADRASFDGEVTLDGDPLEKGKITFIFVGDASKIAFAEIAKGKFSISRREGPMIGANKIQIYGQKGTGKMIDKVGGRPGEQIEDTVEAVAKQFNVESTLTHNVVAGSNTRKFEVTSK